MVSHRALFHIRENQSTLRVYSMRKDATIASNNSLDQISTFRHIGRLLHQCFEQMQLISYGRHGNVANVSTYDECSPTN